jgi:hypothetical protein
LLRHITAYRPLFALAWHGALPDSGRQREIRPKRGHPMLQNVRCVRPATAPRALPAPTSRCGARPPDAPWRRPTDQTSTPESPANGQPRKPSDYSGKQRRPASRSPHECQDEDRSTDAKGTAAPETRYRGRSQASLYNTTRPHSGLGWMTPITYAAARRSAALRSPDGSAPRTAAITAQQGITRQTPVPTG